MPIQIDSSISPEALLPAIDRMWELSAQKVRSIERSWSVDQGTPVFTSSGRYTSRGWTEWTQGFQYGSAILQFDATDDPEFLEIGRRQTVRRMASHVSHVGVHDHGFNNVSTYGNLRRLAHEGRFDASEGERDFYDLALKVSGAIQAARWTPLQDGRGYIYSFNGPQSLFIDTIRSLRSLIVAHQLGHLLMGERDARICLLDRACTHVEVTLDYNVYFGRGRDAYDVRGRVAHESIFNTNDGTYRCPSSQQGYSPFTTWTRGLAWALCGLAEQLQFLNTLPAERTFSTRQTTFQTHRDRLLDAARATADFYIANSCTDGVPFWDTGAPNLWRLNDPLAKASDPFNPWEPIDSSAAAIAAQGFLRLSDCFALRGRKLGRRYQACGLTIAATLLSEPYLSTSSRHQGLLLHSVYHRPNGWDRIAPKQKVPNGESSLWGDYHLRELALLIQRLAAGNRPLTFFLPPSPPLPQPEGHPSNLGSSC